MYRLKLMFEWGGGTIWCENDSAREQYGIGSVEEKLPLLKETLEELQSLTELHDTALNWDYPPDPSPWNKQEFEAFEAKAQSMLSKLKSELGSQYEISYKPVGG